MKPAKHLGDEKPCTDPYYASCCREIRIMQFAVQVVHRGGYRPSVERGDEVRDTCIFLHLPDSTVVDGVE